MGNPELARIALDVVEEWVDWLHFEGCFDSPDGTCYGQSHAISGAKTRLGR